MKPPGAFCELVHVQDISAPLGFHQFLHKRAAKFAREVGGPRYGVKAPSPWRVGGSNQQRRRRRHRDELHATRTAVLIFLLLYLKEIAHEPSVNRRPQAVLEGSGFIE